MKKGMQNYFNNKPSLSSTSLYIHLKISINILTTYTASARRTMKVTTENKARAMKPISSDFQFYETITVLFKQIYSYILNTLNALNLT